mmetsp:Transcript_17305/g.31182  ORF Transcript_17305/g.31182 Transcript_17305/m.31182 type:complete len:188 (+) Transcript_17305:5963-6526(+)
MSTSSFLAREFTIAILGSAAVGKTSLCLQFTRNRFLEIYHPTSEDSYRKAITMDGTNVVINIIDTAGMEHNPGQTTSLIRDCTGFILVYDITNSQTFIDIQEIQSQVLDITAQRKVTFALVGNKSDLESRRQVPEDKGRQLALLWGCSFYETSAKNRVNHEQCFMNLVRDMTARKTSTTTDRCCMLQ